MSHNHHSTHTAIILVLLLCLGLVFDRQVLASHEVIEASEPAARQFLPMTGRGYRYSEAAGILDPDFDDDGVLVTVMGNNGGISDLIIQPDGKVLTVGRIFRDVDWDIGLARYFPNGNLDTRFGKDGIVFTDLEGAEEPQAIALQQDGKIVVAGYTQSESTINLDFILVRYNPDGSLDTSFDGDGMVTTDFCEDADYGYDVAVQPDGKIIVTGLTMISIYESDIALVRYNPDGSLDTSFGSEGKVVTASGNDYGDAAYAVVLQQDGKIVVGGTIAFVIDGFYYPKMVLARYNQDGSLDTSFAMDGLAINDIYLVVNTVLHFDLLLQPDNKFVAIWSTFIGKNQDVALVRFNPDGSLDADFGEAGLVTTDWGCAEYPTRVVLQPNGKIIVTGFVVCNGNTAYILARYNPDGSLDNSFGYLGKVLTELGISDTAHALGLLSDGKILVGGKLYDDPCEVFTLVRYK